MKGKKCWLTLKKTLEDSLSSTLEIYITRQCTCKGRGRLGKCVSRFGTFEGIFHNFKPCITPEEGKIGNPVVLSLPHQHDQLMNELAYEGLYGGL